MRIFILIGILPFSAPAAYACDCAGASLLGDQIVAYIFANNKRQITVSNAIELPKVSDKMIPNSTPHRFNIDIKESSIFINFDHDFDDNQSSYGPDATFHFDDINPQLAGSECTTRIAGMYIQTNNPEATSLNAKSTFSDHKISVVFGSEVNQENSTPQSNWSKNHWIKVNLTFGCSAPVPTASARKGMTWGFRGQTMANGPENLVQVGCNSATEWAAGQGGMCDPYIGETSCSKKRRILCMKETGDIPRPAYAVTPGKANFTGWSPREIKLSPETRGDQLTSLDVANNFCGDGWRIAEFHDGHWIEGMDAENHHVDSQPPWELADANSSGGWNFHARFQGDDEKLDELKTERFWVHIKNQEANCWDL